MTFKRAVDPFILFSEFLHWVGYLRNLYWIVRKLQKIASSKSLLFWGMRLTVWTAYLRYDLPRGRLPSSSSFSLVAIESPFVSILNRVYLVLAIKYEPSIWIVLDGTFPRCLDWGKALFKVGWNWRTV